VTITVEFFGIPRHRAETASCKLVFDQPSVTLGDVVMRLAERFPALARDCVRSDRLARGYAANLRGERFVTDPLTMLSDGDALLILSADAGG